jgi:methyltransferase (TIGR00027 family)
MMARMAETSGASRTAVLVCQGRAVAHDRLAPGRFSDPIAALLLREGEREVVEQVRTGDMPSDWRQRLELEMLQACVEVIVPRTVAIDDAVRARLAPQLVILGAGLDGRAWRMPELAEVVTFEVDHPASQQDKQNRLSGLPPTAGVLRLVPVDLSHDRFDPALAAAGHDPAVPTTWIWEGVVPYLTRQQVAATVAALGARSAPGSRLIVNYQQPSVTARLGLLVLRAMLRAARRTDPLAGEPRRSSWTPAAMRRLLAGRGFAVSTDDDLRTVAERLGITVREGPSLRNDRVLVADLG